MSNDCNSFFLNHNSRMNFLTASLEKKEIFPDLLLLIFTDKKYIRLAFYIKAGKSLKSFRGTLW